MFKGIKISTFSLMAFFFSACKLGNSESLEKQQESEKQVEKEKENNLRKAP